MTRPGNVDIDFVNPLKCKLVSGRVTTMLLVTSPSVASMQVLAHSGIDALVIDMEHGPITVGSAHALIAATAGSDAAPLVRVPWNVPWIVKPLIDAGAMGIVFPMIATAADAEAAVRSLRYPPAGTRGWGPFYAPLRWGTTMPEYMRRADDELLCVITIEQPEAIDNLPQIVRVPGIDLIVLAGFDLSMLMGQPANPGHPDVQAALRRAECIVLDAGIPLCGAALTQEQGNDCIQRGYRSLFLGFDWMMLQRGIAGSLAGLVLPPDASG